MDLEVSVVLTPEKGGDAPQTVILKRNARGDHHEGRFAPERDRRLRVVTDAADTESPKTREVESVVFKFSNSFSWFTAKDVEFVLVCE